MSEILDNLDKEQELLVKMCFLTGLIVATSFLFFYSLINALIFHGLWHIFVLVLSMFLIFMFFRVFSSCSRHLKEVLKDDTSDL